MLCIYDMVEARSDENLDAPEVDVAFPHFPVLPDWPMPRLQTRDFHVETKVVLPPVGLPH